MATDIKIVTDITSGSSITMKDQTELMHCGKQYTMLIILLILTNVVGHSGILFIHEICIQCTE